MAVIREKQNSPLYQESGLVDGAGDLVIEVDTTKHWFQTHWFAGVDFYSDADLTVPVTASAGTITPTVQLSVSREFVDLESGGFPASDTSKTFSFAANPDTVRLTFAGVDSGLYARVRLAGNTT